MAIVVEDFTFVTADASSVTLDKPSGVVAGDLLYIIAMRDPTFSNPVYEFPPPSGWTEHLLRWSDQFVQIQTMYRVADGTEGASETLTSGFSRSTVAWYLRVSGVDNSDPIGVDGTYEEDVTSIIVPSITTTIDNSLVFVLCAFDGGDMDPFSLSGTGWPTTIPTDQYLEEDDLGTTIAGLWLTKTVSSAGSSENFTISSSENDGILGIQFSLNPSDAPPPSGYSNNISGISYLNISSFSGVSLSNIASISGV